MLRWPSYVPIQSASILKFEVYLSPAGWWSFWWGCLGHCRCLKRPGVERGRSVFRCTASLQKIKDRGREERRMEGEREGEREREREWRREREREREGVKEGRKYFYTIRIARFPPTAIHTVKVMKKKITSMLCVWVWERGGGGEVYWGAVHMCEHWLLKLTYTTTKIALEKQAPQHMDSKNSKRNTATKAR